MSQYFKAFPLIAGLAAFAWLCSRFGFADFVAALHRINLGFLALYGAAAVLVLLGSSARWLVMGRAMGMNLSLQRLAAARLAGEAVSVLLPGGKIGGDPLRAALLYADGLSGARASAGVALDRVTEIIGNTLCAIAYISIVSLTRAGGGLRGLPVLLITALSVSLLGLMAAVAVLRQGGRPFTPVFALIVRLLAPLRVGTEAVRRTEDQLIHALRRHPRAFVYGVLGTLMIEAMIIMEYHYMLAAFGVGVDLLTLFAVIVGSGLARAVPTPGSIGALEVSQVAALSITSGRPDIGFVVGMIVRLHETLWTGLGLLVLSLQGPSFARLRVLAARKAAA